MTEYIVKSQNIRQTITDNDGSLIELNLCYPQLSALRNKYLEKMFNNYYKTIADGLKKFVNYKLTVLASKSRAIQGTDFKKWAVVSKYNCSKTTTGYEIKMKVWIFKDGARKEKILRIIWELSE